MTPEQLDDLSIRTALAAGAEWLVNDDRFTWLMLSERFVAEKDKDKGLVDIGAPYATDRDAFFRDIVPRLKEDAETWNDFLAEIEAVFLTKVDPGECDDYTFMEFMLDLEPHELCKAAIAVLQPDWRDAPMPPVETDYPVRDEDLESCEEDDGTRWTD